VKHIIASATAATTADDINVTALDAVHWIDSARKVVSETTIKNTFRVAGFVQPPLIDDLDMSLVSSLINDSLSHEEKAIEELDRILKHVTIGGKTMSAHDYIVRSRTEFLQAHCYNIVCISDI
jgi:hypothetical protein